MAATTYPYAAGQYGQVAYAGGYAPNGGSGGGTVVGGYGGGAGMDLLGVLNYLAGIPVNGGDYGGALAANSAWASINGHGALPATTGAYQSMVGALNAKAGTVGQEIDLVCNTIAGTTGLEAALALRVYAGLP